MSATTRRSLPRVVGASERTIGALLSSDDCGSSVVRTGKLHPLWQGLVAESSDVGGSLVRRSGVGTSWRVGRSCLRRCVCFESSFACRVWQRERLAPAWMFALDGLLGDK